MEEFKASEHGFEEAKQRAIELRQAKEAAGRAAQKRYGPVKSPVRGVHYDKSMRAWRAVWDEGGKQRRKSFAVSTLGSQTAFEMAVQFRLSKEASKYVFVQREDELGEQEVTGGAAAGSTDKTTTKKTRTQKKATASSGKGASESSWTKRGGGGSQRVKKDIKKEGHLKR
mmetsp:Transcript_773/g.1660  ORF Transcript_773/g.1660 Transcript_773/m.1660 type:complete len:170 (+) Transcript_773:235-744(+)